jgi:glycosyltransferase involved in cell wall biosynthesis
VLFLGQGAMGSAVIGPKAVEASLRKGLAATSEIDAKFVSLSPWTRTQRLGAAPVPLLRRLDADLQTTRWHLIEGLRARRLLRKQLASFRPDVLHINSHVASILSVEEMQRVPTLLSVDVPVWEWHRLGIWRPARKYSRQFLWLSLKLERRALAAAAGIVAFTETVRDWLLDVDPRLQVEVIHPGVDLQLFRPAEKPSASTRRVLFVGGRFEKKGGFDLLAALESRIGQDVELDLVTSASLPERSGLRVHRLAPGDPDLVELFRRADILALPSRGEAVPWAVIEAMACGVAVVATSVGSVPELLAGDRGLVVPPGDVESLQAALTRLLGDSVLRAEMGQHGRLAAEKLFDARRQGRRLAHQIMRVADRTHSSA